MNGLRIRPVRFDDAAEIYRAMKRKDIQNFQYAEKRLTLQRQEAWLAGKIASTSEKVFAIIYRGHIIGTCGLHEIDRANQNARAGIMIFSKKNRNHGFASAAMRKLINVAFSTFRLHKVYLKVFHENTPSSAKYAHIGFRFETRLEEHYKLNGTFKDLVVMSIFRRDWQKISRRTS